MTMVSRRPLYPEIEERIRDLLCDSVAKLTKKQDVADFFNEFFTPTEKVMFAKRLAVAVLLAKEYDFRSIRKILKVSNDTIDNVNYWIKHSKKFLKNLVDKIIEQKKKEEASHNFWYSVESASVALHRGNWGERRKQIEAEHRAFKRRHVV